ncbi:MAG: hypothetical protein Aurels2KO_33710 [Aureliella sp.]
MHRWKNVAVHPEPFAQLAIEGSRQTGECIDIESYARFGGDEKGRRDECKVALDRFHSTPKSDENSMAAFAQVLRSAEVAWRMFATVRKKTLPPHSNTVQ